MSSLVFPFHDPKNIETKFLKQVFPILRNNFENAFVSITPKTVVENPEVVAYLQDNKFFIVNFNTENSMVGDHFVAAFINAVKYSKPEQVLHLCTLDRLAFALLTEYKNDFIKDLNNREESPILYTRSPKAWATHPQNYFAAESMITTAGKIMFDKDLDFAWCHLTLTALQLKKIMPNLVAKDLVVFAQLVFNLRELIVTKEVEWLSWEDPFIFNKDSDLYKKEREQDLGEVEKRMGYVTPMIKYLFEEYRKLV